MSGGGSLIPVCALLNGPKTPSRAQDPTNTGLPSELWLLIFNFAEPKCFSDWRGWRAHAWDRSSWSRVNTTWRCLLLQQNDSHTWTDIIDLKDSIPSSDSTGGRREFVNVYADRRLGKWAGEQSRSVGSAHFRGPTRSHESFMLQKLDSTILLHRALRRLCLVGIAAVPLAAMAQLENLTELYCVRCAFRTEDQSSLDKTLALQRLILFSSELPVNFPVSCLPALTHLAQMSSPETSRRAALFERDNWLKALAPQLHACTLTLVGTGTHSDLPILRAMTRIKICDLFVPYSVGVYISTILGRNEDPMRNGMIVEYEAAIGSTIESLKLEIDLAKFHELLQFAELNAPPPRLTLLKFKLNDVVQQGSKDRLTRLWSSVRIEFEECFQSWKLNKLEKDEKEDRRLKELVFWQQVEYRLV